MQLEVVLVQENIFGKKKERMGGWGQMQVKPRASLNEFLKAFLLTSAMQKCK